MMSARGALLAIGGLAAAAVAATLWSRRHRHTADDRERERRTRISTTGRIIDGTVTDVHEIVHEDGRATQLLLYRYEIAGVQYEASQDVTRLRQLIDVHSCRLGLPASIKYDPKNPGNSVVIAEGWSGLRR
jgi:hypothetical protein